MVKISILIALLPHLCCTVVLHDTSPCSRYFTYLTDLETIDILGQIEIPSPPVNEEFYLRVIINTEMSSDQMSSLRRFVQLVLAGSIEESVRAVQQGRPLLYYIYFPSHLNPTLSAIWFNNQKYCSASGGNRIAIELGHIVYPPNGEPFSQNFQPWHRNSSSYFNPVHSIKDHNINECGITNYYTDDANRMVLNGDHVLPGQWPWLVALFNMKPYGNGFDFLCAGTILSNRHIITAAYCLINVYQTISSNELKVSLGQFSFHQVTVNREVASYKIHPDYRHTNFIINNLAILILKTPVEYCHFIKPICLWSGSTNFEDVVHKLAYIVGWTPNENCEYDIEPRMMKVPIMIRDICLRRRWIIISKDNFCMRLLDEYRLCNHFDGDRGNGLVLFDNITGHYKLRGVVSHVLRENVKRLNITWKYIMYTDVAKYIPWIQEQISTT